MKLALWNSLRELGFRDDVGHLFDDLGAGWLRPLPDRAWIPSLDVSETADSLLVKVELPGIDPRNIDVRVEGNVLSIKGERKQEKEEAEENYHRTERSYGAFRRAIQLPVAIDPDGVSATYKDGVLKLTVPRKDGAHPRRIEVKAA
ncbi:MAG: Hsp20/alpha crystallin family protein [Pseudomonadota bacterium]